MELVLQRYVSDKGATTGFLTVDGEIQCYTLEDEVRPPGEKVYGQTAIPPGRYQVVMALFERKGVMLPLLLNVPMFTGIFIHTGNTIADTQGCILVGDRIGDDRCSLLYSRAAMGDLQPLIEQALAQGDEVWITILNAETDA